MIEEIKNPYGYYELEYHQTEEGINEQAHIDYLINQWRKEDDEKVRLLRMRKIKNILKQI